MQIFRHDGKSCFVEVMDDAFKYGKILLNFVQYDTAREKGSRQTAMIPIYLPVEKVSYWKYQMESGDFRKTLESVRNGSKNIGLMSYTSGTSAKALAKRGKSRKDGKSISRVFQGFVGAKADYMLSAKQGPGEERATGIIVPVFGNNPENKVTVPFSEEALYSVFTLGLMAYNNYKLGEQFSVQPQPQANGFYEPVACGENIPQIFS